MKYIKTKEALFTYFSKLEREKREVKKKLIKYIRSGDISISSEYERFQLHGVDQLENYYTRLGSYIYIRILDNLSIDVSGDLTIYYSNKLDIKFNKITGTFRLERSHMINLMNLPNIILGNCYLNENGIDSFKSLPIKSIGGNLEITGNNIKTLENVPEIGGIIDLSYNDIYSLDIILKNTIYITGNPIGFNLLKNNRIYNMYEICKDEKIYDLYKDFDPIRSSTKGKPILYMDRLNMFLDYTGYKIHSSNLKQYYNVQ